MSNTYLPKKFNRDWSESFDRDFLIILLVSLFIHVLIALYFVFNPLPATLHHGTIRNIQDQFANIVLKREVEAIKVANQLTLQSPVVSAQETQDAVARQSALQRRQSSTSNEALASGSAPISTTPSGVGQGEGTGIGDGAGPGIDRSGANREEARRQIEESIAGQGILGVLTGSGPAKQDPAVGDVLGSRDGTQSDYGQVFDNLDKIRTQGGTVKGADSGTSGGGSGTRPGGARGGRATEGGNIDDYISDLGQAQTATGMDRKLDYIATNLTPLDDTGKEFDMGAVKAGARDIDDVAQIVYSHNSAIQYCYDRELRRNPDLKGKVSVRLTILPAGTVTNVNIISSTLKSDAVERCIVSRISLWDDFGEIDPGLGNATFRQVYTFGY